MGIAKNTVLKKKYPCKSTKSSPKFIFIINLLKGFACIIPYPNLYIEYMLKNLKKKTEAKKKKKKKIDGWKEKEKEKEENARFDWILSSLSHEYAQFLLERNVLLSVVPYKHLYQLYIYIYIYMYIGYIHIYIFFFPLTL